MHCWHGLRSLGLPFIGLGLYSHSRRQSPCGYTATGFYYGEFQRKEGVADAKALQRGNLCTGCIRFMADIDGIGRGIAFMQLLARAAGGRRAALAAFAPSSPIGQARAPCSSSALPRMCATMSRPRTSGTWRTLARLLLGLDARGIETMIHGGELWEVECDDEQDAEG